MPMSVGWALVRPKADAANTTAPATAATIRKPRLLFMDDLSVGVQQVSVSGVRDRVGRNTDLLRLLRTVGRARDGSLLEFISHRGVHESSHVRLRRLLGALRVRPSGEKLSRT